MKTATKLIIAAAIALASIGAAQAQSPMTAAICLTIKAEEPLATKMSQAKNAAEMDVVNAQIDQLQAELQRRIDAENNILRSPTAGLAGWSATTPQDCK